MNYKKISWVILIIMFFTTAFTPSMAQTSMSKKYSVQKDRDGDGIKDRKNIF